jgi:hypothetical protein
MNLPPRSAVLCQEAEQSTDVSQCPFPRLAREPLALVDELCRAGMLLLPQSQG